MFVFLVLPILYPNNTLTGFAKATKTCQAAKQYWRPLNSKRSLPVLKLTSESESFKKNNMQSKSNHLTPRCACTAQGNFTPCANMITYTWG